MDRQQTDFYPGAERSGQMEKSCGAVVFTRESGEIRYVLAQSLDGLYGFPKGHMEKGETEQQTALREIREEVGLSPRLIDGFRECIEHPLPARPGVMKRVVYFLAEYEHQAIVYQASELLNALLVGYEEALSLLPFENTRRILTQAHAFLQKY